MIERIQSVGCFLIFLLVLFVDAAFAQKADTSSVEWMEVYFNMPGDHSVAKENNISNDETDLLQTLLTRIDSAKYSIDLAIYDLENLKVGEALVRAKERGVRVRIATDYYNRYNDRELDEPMWELLRKAGIYSIDDGGDVFNPDGSVLSNRLTGASYDMHNKFGVFDKLSENPDDDYIWTGSMNMTYTGPINTNNTIVIKDSGIADAYYKEFKQMWGGDGDRPNPEKARYHKDKNYVGENTFYVDSTRVELFFAPINRDDTKPSPAKRIHELIRDEAQQDVNFLAFAITHDIPLSQEMWERSFEDGIQLQGLIDPRFYTQYKNAGVIWATPEAQIGTRNIREANELRTLHSKVMLIDVAQPFENNRGIAIAGSYNYSRNAEENNDENLLIIHSPRIANQYYQDFVGAMNRATGKWSPPVPRIYSDEWYPVIGIKDGNQFEIEIAKGFGYPVRLLGVDAPRIYAGPDSSEYYSGQAAVFLSNLLEDKEVRLMGYDAGVPESRYGSFRAYVQARDEQGNIINLNSQLIKKGFGEWTPYFRQHPDSIASFQQYTRLAKSLRAGMWKNSERVSEKIARVELGSDGDDRDVTFPININIADETALQALVGIGPAYAARIVKYRLENGLFKDVNELTNIRGIGPVTMQKLRPYITIK